MTESEYFQVLQDVLHPQLRDGRKIVGGHFLIEEAGQHPFELNVRGLASHEASGSMRASENRNPLPPALGCDGTRHPRRKAVWADIRTEYGIPSDVKIGVETSPRSPTWGRCTSRAPTLTSSRTSSLLTTGPRTSRTRPAFRSRRLKKSMRLSAS